MKFFTLVLLPLIASEAFSSTLKLKCIARYNSEKVFERDLELGEGTKKFPVGATEGFEFFLSHTANQTLELESYESGEPSRTFVTAQLSGPKSFIELSVWKRDYLLDVRCSTNP